MATPTASFIKKYAREDIQEAVDRANERVGSNITISNLDFDTHIMEEELRENGGNYTVASSTDVTATLNTGDDEISVTYNYFIGDNDDDIFVSESVDALSDRIASALGNRVEASQSVDGDAITAAGDLTGDEFDDQLDDMAGSLEDMQETLEEVDEDEPNIEVDNNISDHYIAECDRCHGVFISAMVESDQEVEIITGVCPLCGKESDQYLKWIIRDVDAETDEVEVELADEYKPIGEQE